MDHTKPTLAVYGIQDRYNYKYPFYVHDHNLALMQNGEVINFLQLERETRIKRDNKLHENIYRLLKQKKLIPGDYDLMFVDNVVGRTFLTPTGDARFEAPLAHMPAAKAEPGKCWWFGAEREAWALNHELAHVFSCLPFFGNFKDNSLLVHFDGGASLSNFSAWAFKDGKINLVEFHWDLKFLSAIYNANALTFAIIGAGLEEQNSVPGKFMGYAGWGRYNPDIENWLVENNYFETIWSKKTAFLKKAGEKWGVSLKSFDQRNGFLKDVAATLQYIFRRETVRKLKELAYKTKCRHLYYTGGCALNIYTNTAIVESALFDSVFIPPCTEDSGLSLGAAAYLEWEKHGEVKSHTPYLNNWGIEDYSTDFSDEDIKKTAYALSKGKIIGVCNGYGEAGPRALGNRSLLALANSKRLAGKISRELKGREWYRPVAPVALSENVKYFTGEKSIHHLAKYMLLDFPVVKEKQAEIAGALHANQTARFQSVSDKNDNQFLYDLLKYLDENFKIKALINTSFNTHGKPLVHTTEDTWAAAKKMKLDGLVINGKFQEL